MPVKQRLMLIFSAKLIFIGIWLSGWDQVHWFSYLVPGLFTFFALTGICPGTIKQRIMRKTRAG